jgi:hypothetical protein
MTYPLSVHAQIQEPHAQVLVTSPDSLLLVIEQVVQKQEQQHEAINDLQFSGHSIFREMDPHGNLKKEMMIERIVYEKGDKQATRYLLMSKNGVTLDEKQKENEIANWEKQGKKRGTTKMPFDPQYTEVYEYVLERSTMYQGVQVWVVGFEPKQKEEGYISGRAYIDPVACVVMRIEATPVKLPGVIKEMTMVYIYQPEQGYWLPAGFEFSMRLKVQFVLTFVHTTYTLEDRYSDFVLNSDLPDSLFTESD